MEQGDVFTVKGKEPLFIAEKVTPNGTVYARKFDLSKSAYGGTEAFQPNTEFKIRFNSLGLLGNISRYFAKVQIGAGKLLTSLKKSVFLHKENSVTSAMRTISINELEERMRPAAYSSQGFLGQTESLENVVAQDSQTLKTLGISHEQIAIALENVMQCVKDQSYKLSEDNYPEFVEREGEGYIPDLYHPESIPRFSLDNLPNTDVGYLVGNKLQVFNVQYRGMQECPWGCEYEEWGSFEFLILNRQSGKFVTFPGLIVHLIRKHHFFEGLESPYRVDPAEVVQVLELVSKAGIG
jgi:hypothetical protein